MRVVLIGQAALTHCRHSHYSFEEILPVTDYSVCNRTDTPCDNCLPTNKCSCNKRSNKIAMNYTIAVKDYTARV